MGLLPFAVLLLMRLVSGGRDGVETTTGEMDIPADPFDES